MGDEAPVYSEHKSIGEEDVGHYKELNVPWYLGEERYWSDLGKITNFIIRAKAGTLSFMEALSSVRGHTIAGSYEQMKLDKPKRQIDVPHKLREIMFGIVNKKYLERRPGDECSKFLK